MVLILTYITFTMKYHSFKYDFKKGNNINFTSSY